MESKVTAEELMFDNWLMNGGKPKQVIQINRDGSIRLNPDMREYVWLSECEPIPLRLKYWRKRDLKCHLTMSIGL